MRGVDLALGGVLIVAGLVGALPGAPMVPVADEDLEGAVRFHDWTYHGAARVQAADAGLRAAGSLDVKVRGDVLVEVFRYEESHNTGFQTAGDVPDVFKWDYRAAWRAGVQTVESHATYPNATIHLAGDQGARLFAWADGNGPANFDLQLENTTGAQLSPSSFATYWGTRDGAYSYQYEAPVFLLGHGATREHPLVHVSNASFDRLQASGGIELFLEGPARLDVHHEGVSRSFETWEREGFQAQTPGGPNGAGTELGHQAQYARIVLQNASFDMGFGGVDSVFQFRAGSWDVQGTLEVPVEEGWIAADGTNHSLEGDSVKIEGNTTLDLEATGIGTLARDAGDVVTPNAMAVDEPVVDGKIRGDPRTMSINGQDVLATAGSAAAPSFSMEEATLIAKILSGLLVAWGAVRFLLPTIVGMVADRPLGHPRRREIYALLKTNGMAHLSGLEQATGIPRGSLEYHLAVLRRGGLVSRVVHGAYKIYFLSSPEFRRDDLVRLAPLADPTRRRICAILVADATVSQDELAGRLQIAKSNVSRQLAMLVESGLAERKGARNARYDATDLLVRWFTRRPGPSKTHVPP